MIEKNKILRLADRLSDLILLNILFIITSIPIITIVDSTIAIMGMIEKRNYGFSDLIKGYFSLFKLNFLNSIKISVVGGIIFFGIFSNLDFLSKTNMKFVFPLLGVSIFLLLTMLMVLTQISYILGTKLDKLVSALKVALGNTFKNPLQLISLTILFCLLISFWFLAIYFFKLLFLMLAICGFSLYFLAVCKIFRMES